MLKKYVCKENRKTMGTRRYITKSRQKERDKEYNRQRYPNNL